MHGLIDEMGFVGNVWVRKTHLLERGDHAGGHAHYHDHVTLLAKGSVEVTIGDMPPKVFKAPTFIIIKKEHRHNFVALEDDTVFYCVFAMRDIDGSVVDIYDERNMPNIPLTNPPDYTRVAPNDYWQMQD